MAAVFAVAEHFNTNPVDVLNNWTYPLFLDAIERIHVINEIDYRNMKKHGLK